MRFLLISILGIFTLGLSFWNFFPRKNSESTGLQVFSKPAGVQVFLNDQAVGVTPYQNQRLREGEVKLKIGTGAASFSKLIKLTPKVFTIVNRELADNQFLESGEVLNLETGAGLFIISTPEHSKVEVDNKEIGVTPVKLDKIDAGSHKVVVAKDGFIPRAVQIQTHPNYRLILDVTLAATAESLTKILGPAFATPAADPAKVKILTTPTGFLRVRNNPSFGGTEITRVAPGDELILLEEKPGWSKIRLADGREGWVSTQYAKRL